MSEAMLDTQDLAIIDRLLSGPRGSRAGIPPDDLLRLLSTLFPGAVSELAEIDDRGGVVRATTFPSGVPRSTTGTLGVTFPETRQRREVRVSIARLTPPLSHRDRVLFRLLAPRLEGWAFGQRQEPGTDGLSAGELRVLTLVAEGDSNAEVSERLSVTVATVRKHLEHIYSKLGVRNRTAAAAMVFPHSMARP